MASERVRIGTSMVAVGLVFLGLTAYRAGNDPLVLTLIAGLLAAAVLMLKVPRLSSRTWHLVVPVILALVFQAAALIGSGLGCTPTVGPPGSVYFESFQLFPCTIRFSNSLYGLMQTWVVVAGGIIGLAAASTVSLRQISGFLLSACLVLGTVHAMRELFDPYFLPTSVGFVNPNSLATLLVVALLCWIHQVASQWGRSSFPRRPLEVAGWFGIGLMLMLLLILTQSRLGMFVGLSACGVLIVLLLGGRMSRYQMLHLLLLLVVTGLAFLALQALAWVNRVGDLQGSLYERLSIYEQSAGLWRKGVLFGIGVGNFEIVFPAVNADAMLAQKLWTKAHSTYLALYIEQGILGLLAHIYAFGAVIVILLRDWWQRKSGVAGLGLAIVFAIAAHSVFDFSMEIPGVAASVAVMLGAILLSCLAIETGPSAAVEPDA